MAVTDAGVPESGDGWYVDAWNVVDGKAFASWRFAEAPEAAKERQKGSVFLAAPYFEPEWTSRPSTAMAAWRLGFQPGLLDREQREIRFASLEQVRELVRRGFMAGGGGGLDATGTPSPLEGGDGPAPETPAKLFKASDATATIRLDYPALASPASRRVAVASFHQALDQLADNSLAKFAFHSLFLLIAAPRTPLSSASILHRWQAAVSSWAVILTLLTEDGGTAAAAIEQGRSHARHPAMALTGEIRARLLGDGPWRAPVPASDWLDLPRWIPVPRSWRYGPPWILSLGDSVCHAAASFTDTKKAFEEGQGIVPVLAAALSMAAIAAARELDLRISMSVTLERHRAELFDAAARWLAFNLPDDSLPTEAEDALTDSLHGTIARYHRG